MVQPIPVTEACALQSLGLSHLLKEFLLVGLKLG